MIRQICKTFPLYGISACVLRVQLNTIQCDKSETTVLYRLIFWAYAVVWLSPNLLQTHDNDDTHYTVHAQILKQVTSAQAWKHLTNKPNSDPQACQRQWAKNRNIK